MVGHLRTVAAPMHSRHSPSTPLTRSPLPPPTRPDLSHRCQVLTDASTVGRFLGGSPWIGACLCQFTYPRSIFSHRATLCSPVPLVPTNAPQAVWPGLRPFAHCVQADSLKDKYFEWLVEQGQEEKAGEMREREQRYDEAINLYLQGGLPARAALVVTTKHVQVSSF